MSQRTSDDNPLVDAGPAGSEVSRSRWLTGLGILVVVVGLVDLIWEQASLKESFSEEPVQRWSIATAPMILVALGLLVVVAAQILKAVQTAKAPDQPAP
jgi:hypothetical protein